MRAKVFPLISVTGNRTGLGEYYRSMVGKPFGVFINDDVGAIAEAQSYGGQDWKYFFRRVGAQWNTPDYNLSPAEAARRYWDSYKGELVNVPKDVIIITGNEVDKNLPEWLGTWAFELFLLAEKDGRRISVFGFSAGEPEPSFWRSPAVLTLLDLAWRVPYNLMINLHEYSLTTQDDGNTPAILVGSPWMLGRFGDLFAACTQAGINGFPKITIGEVGWEYRAIPEPERAMRDVKLVTEMYQWPEILGAGLWYSGGGFEEIDDMVNKIYVPWAAFNASLDGSQDTTEITPPVEVPAAIDLAEFIVGEEGVQHVLQCRFDDFFQGTQTLCTKALGPGIFAQQKDADQEVIYYDDANIYRDTDTSPDRYDGQDTHYITFTQAQRGAYWANRHVEVGDVFVRNPYVQHYFSANCVPYTGGPVESTLKVTGYYETFKFDEGYVFGKPVVELAWVVDGEVVETYMYGCKRGLVRWEQKQLGWKSFLCEEHYDRPPMPEPSWPSCLARPTPDLLYYAEEPEDLEPLPDFIKVIAQPYLNVRSGPGQVHRIIGQAYPNGHPIEVEARDGDWIEIKAWIHGGYTVPV